MTTTTTQYRKISEVKYDAETGFFGLTRPDGESSYIEMGTMELDTNAIDMRLIHVGKRFVNIFFTEPIHCNVIKSNTMNPRIECGVGLMGDDLKAESEEIGGKRMMPLWKEPRGEEE